MTVGSTVKPAGKFVGMAVGTLVGVGVGTCSTALPGEAIWVASVPPAVAAAAALLVTFRSAAAASLAAASGSAATCVTFTDGTVATVGSVAVAAANFPLVSWAFKLATMA